MIQFNLLPDVKMQFIKALRLKRLVITISIIVAGVSLAIILLLVSVVYGVQRNHLGNLDDDIAKVSGQIQEIDQINRILTVQNQLNTINQLHDQKPVMSRLFGYVEQTTPANVTINRVELNFEAETITVAGETDTLAGVNRYVDTLKFTRYEIVTPQDETGSVNSDNGETNQPLPLAFRDIVLSGFNRTSEEASFTVELKFDPVIFSSDNDILLVVEEQITTRSEIERPQALFRTPDEENGNAQD